MKLLTILSAAAVVAVSMPVASAPALAKRYHHPHRTVHYRTVCKKVRYHHRWVKRCHRVRYYR